MEQNTYTRNGDGQYELVYEVPEDADDDHTVYVTEEDADDGARSESMTLETFRNEFEEYDANEAEKEYLRERARNGYGIQ